MRRVRYGLTAGAFLSLALAATIGCGTGKDDYDRPSRLKGGGSSFVSVQKKLQPVKGSYDGVISGKVVWKGEAITPAPEPFMTDPTKQDASYCKKGGKYETFVQTFWIGDNGNLGNVFVWIEPEDGHFFDVPAAELKPFAKGGKRNIVEITQPHCAFLPHCATLFPSTYKNGEQVPTGQQFIVLNDAKVSHNASIKSNNQDVGSPGTLPPGSKSSNIPLDPMEYPITVTCGIHGWMKGYVRSFDHPYAALTKVGEDAAKSVYQNKKDPAFGTYEIKGVPVGAKVTLKVWHEELGLLESRKITLAKTNTLDFDAKQK